MTDGISQHTVLRESEKDRILRSKVLELVEASNDKQELAEKLACWIKLSKYYGDNDRRFDQLIDFIEEKFNKNSDQSTIEFASCTYTKEKDHKNG